MFLGKVNIMQVILCIACIALLSCSKQTISPTQSTNNMKQVFYTQEGKPYILCSTNKTFSIVIGVNTPLNRVVYVNADASIISDSFAIFMDASKKMIPVWYSCSITDNLFAAIADISSAYYQASQGNTSFATYDKYKPTLAKAAPLVDRIFANNGLNYNFNVRYGQIVFADNDFFEVSKPMRIEFHPNLMEAMTESSTTQPIIVPGTYQVTITFTYFQMQ